MKWTHLLVAWWSDFFVAATVLLVVTWIASCLIRQPVQRLTLAWSAMAALLVLLMCCAAPGWPRMDLIEFMRLSESRPANALASGVDRLLTTERLLPSSAIRNGRSGLPERSRTAHDTDMRDVLVDDSTSQPLDASATLGLDLFAVAEWTIVSSSLLVVAWLAGGRFRVWRLCRRASEAPASAYAELRAIVGATAQCPRLLVDVSLSTAVATGTWRPTILLPRQFGDRSVSASADSQGSTTLSLRALLAHEWAHIEHRDLWLLAIGRVLLVPLFLNPIYWLLWRRICTDQELMADAVAAAHCGRHKYAEMLIAWARHQRPVSQLSWSLGIAQRPSQLSRRIAVLINERMRLQMACSPGWRIAALGGTMTLVACLSFFTLNPASRISADHVEPSALPTVGRTDAVAKDHAPEAKVTIRGKCRDDKWQPIAHARVMLIRIDQSNRSILRPSGRMKWVESAIFPEHAKKEIPLSFHQGRGDPNRQRLVQESRTDADGTFAFKELAADEGWLSKIDYVCIVAQAEGRSTQIQEVNIVKDPSGEIHLEKLMLTLPKAASVRGRITNGDGSPVAGAMVSCVDFHCLAKPLPGVASAITNADGRYEINDVPHFNVDDEVPLVTPFGAIRKASVMLTAEHPGYAPGFVEYTKTPTTIDLVLQRPAALRGRVVFEENDQAAPKTRVRWTHESGLSDAADTDDDGNYMILRLWPAKYTVKAERLDRDRLPATQDVVLAAGENRLDVALKVGGYLKGRMVVAATGEPPQAEATSLSTAMAVSAHLEGRDPFDPSQGNQGYVQADGSFSIPMEPGRYLVHFWHPQWRLVDPDRWAKQGIEVALGQTAEVELHLARRQGGWASLLAEVRAAQPAAKGEPVSPIPDHIEMPDESALTELDDGGKMIKAFMDWPADLLPKETMDYEAMLAMLEGVAEVERRTIEGEEHITSISFGECVETFTDDMAGQILWLQRSLLSNINRLPHLESLMVLGAPGEDSWLEPLCGHQKLQALYLVYSKQVTARGVRKLAGVPNLKIFCAMGFTLGDDALKEVNAFPKLEALHFGGTVTDAGLAYLEGNSKLKALLIIDLGRSKLTDECFRYAASMPNLEHLSFHSEVPDRQQGFTDTALKYLAAHAKLSELVICDARITDDGLAHLHGLKTLRKLTLENTLVTPDGIGNLKGHLPNLDVVARGNHETHEK